MREILHSGLRWSVGRASLSLFVGFPVEESPRIFAPSDVASPSAIKQYRLEDDQRRYPSFGWREFDLTFADVPENLDAVVSTWLEGAIEAGCVVAWFAFEGSFDFNRVLTPDIAADIYGAATAGAVYLALDDERRASVEWAATLLRIRRAASVDQ